MFRNIDTLQGPCRPSLLHLSKFRGTRLANGALYDWPNVQISEDGQSALQLAGNDFNGRDTTHRRRLFRSLSPKTIISTYRIPVSRVRSHYQAAFWPVSVDCILSSLDSAPFLLSWSNRWGTTIDHLEWSQKSSWTRAKSGGNPQNSHPRRSALRLAIVLSRFAQFFGLLGVSGRIVGLTCSIAFCAATEKKPLSEPEMRTIRSANRIYTTAQRLDAFTAGFWHPSTWT
jgi:hypothetical protein